MPQPFASFRRRRGILRGANDGGYPPLRRESFGDTSCKAPPERGGARLWRAEGFVSPCRMVAAALSAAVTTTKQQEPAPNSQAESTPKNRASQTPAALREGARGRGFSQRSRLPRIPRFFSHPRGGDGEFVVALRAAVAGGWQGQHVQLGDGVAATGQIVGDFIGGIL